ncbi:MAG: hypothetical protein R3A10_04285 [Caldilineaceae bacterium]
MPGSYERGDLGPPCRRHVYVGRGQRRFQLAHVARTDDEAVTPGCAPTQATAKVAGWMSFSLAYSVKRSATS